MVSEPSGRPDRSWPKGTFLARLAEADRRALLSLGRPRVCPPGEVLLAQGDPGDHVVLLIDALVTVVARVENGVGALLGIRVGGDLVGEMAVLDGARRSATVTTCVRSMVIRIAKGPFLGYLAEHAAAGLVLNTMLSDRLRWANRRRLDFAGYGVGVCLARVLVDLARLHGRESSEGVDIGVRLSQSELGALIGAKEISVHKALRGLSDQGLVRVGHRRVVILDPHSLMTYAELSDMN
ncbi:Crp/Fnr family transcriptional regulator [Streptosporangium saharense]|uniref:Crp/Fnr family transcriptional regulator n=1 Tax=Streptosporangium saharense TaxID=1706840 RepID=UPI00161EE4AE|nr:Crp/Fnr family transcriptional regulator [Streptosporangium saharense]